MNRVKTIGLAVVVAVVLGSAVAPISSVASGNGRRGPTVFGLTGGGQLIRFNATNSGPRKAKTVGTIGGLAGDVSLIGIDFRVQDGRLYGVGNNGGIYTINTSTAMATPTGTPLTITLDPAATSFGVDFNPAADRLRIIANTGQNLRHNVNSGGVTVADSSLSAAGASGAGYTNNDLDANTATTLFDIREAAAADELTIQAPPNNGTLNTVGRLTVDTSTVVGFDISSRLKDGVARDNKGYASLVVGDRTGLYAINLLTGKASLVGTFRSEQDVTDIAVALEH